MAKRVPNLSEKLRRHLSERLGLLSELYEIAYGRRSRSVWLTPKTGESAKRRLAYHLTRLAELIREENLSNIKTTEQ